MIADRARTSPHVVALNLLRNYGQHHANLAGLREATGDYVITMDDDLQNPPDQALAADRGGDEAATTSSSAGSSASRRPATGASAAS